MGFNSGFKVLMTVHRLPEKLPSDSRLGGKLRLDGCLGVEPRGVASYWLTSNATFFCEGITSAEGCHDWGSGVNVAAFFALAIIILWHLPYN